MTVTAAGVSATAAVIALSLTSYFNWSLYHQNWNRDKFSASARVCETFAFGEGKKATDEVTRVTFYQDKDVSRNKPFTRTVERTTNKEDIRTALFGYANMLGVAAAGLDAEVYDPGILKNCVGDLFIALAPELCDDDDHFLPYKGFERIQYWADKFKSQMPPISQARANPPHQAKCAR